MACASVRISRVSYILSWSYMHWKFSLSSDSSGFGHFQRVPWAPSGGGLNILPAKMVVSQEWLDCAVGLFSRMLKIVSLFAVLCITSFITGYVGLAQ